jgi:hypothetical protein
MRERQNFHPHFCIAEFKNRIKGPSQELKHGLEVVWMDRGFITRT